MKRRDLVKHLTAHGCELLRQGGRHSVFVNQARGRSSAVPRHKEINDILARKICRDLQIPEP
ncbi:MAG: type II toxin-antitoxin system HicA family toxin [Planctomycetota bacterium]|jgi:predicted RNA binding protein YcfA (HicA-like mRNA interferase family)